MPIHFPPLTAEMEAHSSSIRDRLCQEMAKAGGRLSFARFMELALYAPGLGYYSAGMHKLGKSGDFITAPEISPLFAQSLARQFAEVLEKIPEGSILELGAGAGTFAHEVLLELEAAQQLPAKYFILETSADLRERQRKLFETSCPRLLPRLEWLDRLPEHFRGLIFANEVLDALPVHCFQIENQQVKERCVALKDRQFVWELTPPLSPELGAKVSALQQAFQLPEGYQSEINLLLPAWIETLAAHLEQGVILFFDYGYGRQEYYHPQKSQGTLRCYFQHRCHNDPLILVGLQDLTAQVDFTTVVESAWKAGLKLGGYTTQSAFLLSCGITDFAMAPPSSMKHYQQTQALKLLMLPSEMGTLVKALALTKQWDTPLKGFAQFEKRHEL